MDAKLVDLEVPMSQLSTVISGPGIVVAPGALVYITLEQGVPHSLVQRVRVLHFITERMMILRLVTAEVPRVDDASRIDVISDEPHLVEVSATYGFMERPDPPEIVRVLSEQGSGIDPHTCVYSFHSAHVQVAHSHIPEQVATEVFAFMQRNATDPQRYYRLPPERVLEVSQLVTLP